MDAMQLALSYIERGVFQVRKDGSIWRVGRAAGDRVSACKPKRAERPSSNGYLRLVMGEPGARNTISVMAHKVIWVVNHGPIPAGLQVNHKDLCRTNNRLDNLELLDQSKNIRHAYAMGRTRKGPPRQYDHAAIQAMRARGLGPTAIARATGASVSSVARIVRKGAACSV